MRYHHTKFIDILQNKKIQFNNRKKDYIYLRTTPEVFDITIN